MGRARTHNYPGWADNREARYGEQAESTLLVEEGVRVVHLVVGGGIDNPGYKKNNNSSIINFKRNR